jgi:hypothetical protein
MADYGNLGRFYINGEWVAPSQGAALIEVINPATEQSVASVPLGTSADAEKAIAAARAAFPGFSAIGAFPTGWRSWGGSATYTKDVSTRSQRRSARKWARRRPWRNLTRPGRVSAISRRP